ATFDLVHLILGQVIELQLSIRGGVPPRWRTRSTDSRRLSARCTGVPVSTSFSQNTREAAAAAVGYGERSVMRDQLHWARLLAFVTGLVNQELLLRNEYLGAPGQNRHGSEDERALRERSSNPLGPEFCTGRCEMSSE